jgi:hypothetical protein
MRTVTKSKSGSLRDGYGEPRQSEATAGAGRRGPRD